MQLKQFSIKRYYPFIVGLIVFAALSWGAAISCKIELTGLIEGIGKGMVFFKNLFPPDWEAFPEMLQPALDSLILAFLGTFFGTLMAVVFAVLGAANISHPIVRTISRFLIGLERSLPELFILLFLIAAFGLGSMPGIICLSLGCIGMLGKLLADAIEEIDGVLIQSLTAVGANKLQIIVFGIFPEILPKLLAYSLFRLEINIRLSVILGAVGAGGIGYELDYAFSMLQYHRACSALLVVLVLIFGIEKLSAYLRNMLNIKANLK
jgi:phosphonate transport system permease protein